MKAKYFFLAPFMTLLCVFQAQGDEITVATFNTEFLYPKKVHIKYGLKYNMSEIAMPIRRVGNRPDIVRRNTPKQ